MVNDEIRALCKLSFRFADSHHHSRPCEPRHENVQTSSFAGKSASIELLPKTGGVLGLAKKGLRQFANHTDIYGLWQTSRLNEGA